MGRRPARSAAKQAAAALKNTPQTYEEPEDEEEVEAVASEAGSPQNVEEEVAEEEDDATPARDSEPPSAPTTPRDETVTRKRRLGRPPKNKPPDWDTPDDQEHNSDRGTPHKRGRRGGAFGRGGGRWKNRGGPSHVTQQPVDKDGNMADIKDDELILPEDPEGEKKVDKMGYLQDGREYRCRTFRVLGRGERLYMLSTEPARCVGFRDSYLFFAKHKRLYKIIINDEEKKDMIDRTLIPHSYKGRAIGIVTARSVFREFGAQIIVGGKRVIDDYEETKARVEGVTEGELADPNDTFEKDKAYNKNQYVAWHGASSVYHTGQPTVPMPNGKLGDANKKRRIIVNDVNWMLEHARAASTFNSQLRTDRRLGLAGIYDVHTNVMQYPATMQPTHARWEPVQSGATAASNEDTRDSQPSESSPFTVLPPVPSPYTRRFLIVDTLYENPPSSHLGIPGPDSDSYDIGFNGLSSIPAELRNELPEDCRKAFDLALRKEGEWKGRWGTEATDQARRAPIIDKGLIM